MHRPESLLLDTHIWIWAIDGVPNRISPTLRSRIDAATKHGQLYLSAISVWEVGMLQAKNRVALSLDIRAWIRVALDAPGVNLVPLSPEIAIESTHFTGMTASDPADRIIVATARNLNATLVTCDRAILEFARSGSVKTIDARF